MGVRSPGPSSRSGTLSDKFSRGSCSQVKFMVRNEVGIAGLPLLDLSPRLTALGGSWLLLQDQHCSVEI